MKNQSREDLEKLGCKAKIIVAIENVGTLMEIVTKLKQDNVLLKQENILLKNTIVHARYFLDGYSNDSDKATHSKRVLDNAISTFKG